MPISFSVLFSLSEDMKMAKKGAVPSGVSLGRFLHLSEWRFPHLYFVCVCWGRGSHRTHLVDVGSII